MGYKVKSVSSEGIFEIVGGESPVAIKYKTEAEEREEKNLGGDKYLEPAVMFNNYIEDGATDPTGLQPFWAIFKKTTPQKLEKALAKSLLACNPIDTLKSVLSIHDAMEHLSLEFSNIVLLGSGSMHVGGACVCCEHRAENAFDQVAEALVLSRHFKVPLSIQDPAYSQMEKDLLSAKGIQVLDDPDAFACINFGSLVIAKGVWRSLFYTIGQNDSHPAAILSFNVPGQVRMERKSSEYDQEVLDLFVEYDRIGYHDEELKEMWEEEGPVGKGPVGKKKLKERRLQKIQAPCLFVAREE